MNNTKRRVSTPTRSQTFTNLTPQDQREAYCKVKYEKKLVTKQYIKLIDKFEKRNTKLCFDDNSPSKEEAYNRISI